LRDRIGGFAVFAMIDESTDRYAGRKLRSAANVIIVKVGNQDEIDFADASIVCGGDDAIGVTIVITGPSGVDEQRMFVGSDKEGGLAAFDVDEINLQRIFRACGCRCR